MGFFSNFNLYNSLKYAAPNNPPEAPLINTVLAINWPCMALSNCCKILNVKYALRKPPPLVLIIYKIGKVLVCLAFQASNLFINAILSCSILASFAKLSNVFLL